MSERWKFDEIGHSEGFPQVVDADEHPICDIRGWGYLTGTGGLGLRADEAMKEQERWGRLIAAAPDLLAACKEIAALSVGWDEDGSTGPKPPLSWETVARMAMDYARAAIAKAEPEGGKA